MARRPTPAADPTDDDARTWAGEGWTARVFKNEDDEGWAVSMTRDGDDEPVLVSPWTMGRDKKNPKPLGLGDFKTLLKGANDVLIRHQAHARALRHKTAMVADDSGARIRVDLDIIPDEDDPHAILSAWSELGEQLGEQRVAPSFAFSSARARRWVASGYRDS